MSEPIEPPLPGNWSMHTGLSAGELQEELTGRGHRLISIKSYKSGFQRLFAAVSVNSAGVTGDWTDGMLESELRARLARENARLIALDAYDDEAGGPTFCVGAWIRNDGVWSDWKVDLGSSQLRAYLADEHAKLTTLRTYLKSESDFMPDPRVTFTRKYAGIWIRDDGIPWEWRPRVKAGDYYRRLVDVLKDYTVISHDACIDVGPLEFAFVSWKGGSPFGAYWYPSELSEELEKRVRDLCSYPMDVVPSDSSRFALSQFAYPPAPDPTRATLLTFGGTATIDPIATDFQQSVSAAPSLQNVSTADVTLTRAVRFLAGPGGWCYFWKGTLTATDHGQEFFLPASTPATVNVIPAGAASPVPAAPLKYPNFQPVQFVATHVEATNAARQYQEVVSCISAAAPGEAPDAPFDFKAPVSVGVQGPLEILKMTDGNRYLEIRGRVICFSSRFCEVRGIALRLIRPDNTTALIETLPLKLKVDFNVNGDAIDAVDYDARLHRRWPLPRFRHLLKVPDDFNGGQLEVDLRVQMGPRDPILWRGELECASDTRRFPVTPGYVESIGSPLAGRVRWDQGPCASDWHPHWNFHERYAYDLINVDESGSPHTDDGTENRDYFCFGKPVYAIADGVVIRVVRRQRDHVRVGDTSGQANEIVICSGPFYHVYSHLKQRSARFRVGTSVRQGDVIAQVGNSGNSSGPHLHFGLYTYQPHDRGQTTGIWRPVAVSLDRPTGVRGTPVRVPISGQVMDIPEPSLRLATRDDQG